MDSLHYYREVGVNIGEARDLHQQTVSEISQLRSTTKLQELQPSLY